MSARSARVVGFALFLAGSVAACAGRQPRGSTSAATSQRAAGREPLGAPHDPRSNDSAWIAERGSYCLQVVVSGVAAPKGVHAEVRTLLEDAGVQVGPERQCGSYETTLLVVLAFDAVAHSYLPASCPGQSASLTGYGCQRHLDAKPQDCFFPALDLKMSALAMGTSAPIAAKRIARPAPEVAQPCRTKPGDVQHADSWIEPVVDGFGTIWGDRVRVAAALHPAWAHRYFGAKWSDVDSQVAVPAIESVFASALAGQREGSARLDRAVEGATALGPRATALVANLANLLGRALDGELVLHLAEAVSAIGPYADLEVRSNLDALVREVEARYTSRAYSDAIDALKKQGREWEAQRAGETRSRILTALAKVKADLATANDAPGRRPPVASTAASAHPSRAATPDVLSSVPDGVRALDTLRDADRLEAASYFPVEYGAVTNLLAKARTELSRGDRAAAKLSLEQAQREGRALVERAKPNHDRSELAKQQKNRERAFSDDLGQVAGAFGDLPMTYFTSEGRRRQSLIVPAPFGKSRTTLQPTASATFDAVAKVIQKYADYPVEVAAYADARDTPAHLAALSLERAQVVVSRLASRGVDQNRLKASGKGASRADTGESSEQKRDRENRVEIVFELP